MTGQLKGDGRATTGGVAAPNATHVQFGELYRIAGITGFALSDIGATDTLRGLDLEIDTNRVWYIHIPAAIHASAVAGACLYWNDATIANFQDGTANLVAAASGKPVACFVEEAAFQDGDGNWCAGVRAINNGYVKP